VYNGEIMDYSIIVMIVALVVSVIIHEMAHGYMANYLGDPTARLQGRLSANPLVHIDPMMSVILPLILIMSGSPFIFGAAKPVPYNPYNLRNQKWGEALVAVAGPLSNIALAVIFALLYRYAAFTPTFTALAFNIIGLNIFLALFNMVPLPPLDGSKILPTLLPFQLRIKYERFRFAMEQNVTLAFGIVILTFMFVLGGPLEVLTQHLTILLAGQ
jgi:Zn-dependent protease